MPSLRRRRFLWVGTKPTPTQRLQRWIREKAVPPAHMVKRPLHYLLPDKVWKSNKFVTPDVWLTEFGELRLGSIHGSIIGKIPGTAL